VVKKLNILSLFTYGLAILKLFFTIYRWIRRKRCWLRHQNVHLRMTFTEAVLGDEYIMANSPKKSPFPIVLTGSPLI